uniref:Uncharacterized protein n=1 Tax=viral metagenome TaxID=1070528 RepID=A0A6C0D2W3_9ZZZZ
MYRIPHKIISVYSEWLPPFLVYSVFSSYITGLNVKSSGPNETFEHLISYTTLGLAFGFLYPVSYPLCTGYTLYKKLK